MQKIVILDSARIPQRMLVDTKHHATLISSHVKLKENEDTEKYQDLGHELKNFGTCCLRLS